MDTALRQCKTIDMLEKVRAVSEMCRISRIEKLLADCFETCPENSMLNYVGELNQKDAML